MARSYGYLNDHESRAIAEQAAENQSKWRAQREIDIAGQLQAVRYFTRAFGNPEGDPITAGHQLANNPPPFEQSTQYDNELEQGEQHNG